MLQGDLHSSCNNYTTRENILSTNFIENILKNNYKTLHVIAYVSRYICIVCSVLDLLYETLKYNTPIIMCTPNSRISNAKINFIQSPSFTETFTLTVYRVDSNNIYHLCF